MSEALSVTLPDAAAADANTPLLELKDVEVDLALPGRPRTRLLDGINLSVRADELVAVLGPTGSGKSTLVRVAAGLQAPNKGMVEVKGTALRGVSPRVGVVFQTPALFPWLSVQANVELGLEKLPADRGRKEQMVAWAIDRLGLEGFEEAYPRELSQGMKLRVALARALAAQPELLILDDPFAGLDVLAAESLRNELVALWQHSDVNPKAILLVTHDIEEAVSLANRVLVLAGTPARLSVELPVALSYPRDPSAAVFQDNVNRIHEFLTKQILPDDVVSSDGGAGGGRFAHRLAPLPKADLPQVLGLLEALDDRGGKLDIFDFAAETRREYQAVVLVVNAAEMLGLVSTPWDQAEITELGRRLLKADVNGRKILLNMQFQKIKLFSDFVRMIDGSPERAITRESAIEQLTVHFPWENPGHLFNTLVAWARYAELFGYSPRRGLLYLDRTFVMDGDEVRETKRTKPAAGRKVKDAARPAAVAETSPVSETVPEPPVPSEAMIQAAEEAAAPLQSPDQGAGNEG
ncbi:MAG TPA: nitrate/sulfonate/bicarbonate ABC transporter ATP-binding protein [bacterium]|jgi:NitT/TauT family transport system ATP-binding protein|nr:nitrate/sulfonate/bicarbonate ABC transporter ATP-binding protein [bacterium]